MNKDYLHNIQLNIFIKKDEQTQKVSQSIIKKHIDALNTELFEKVHTCIIYEESHDISINILGVFSPYKNTDRRKYSDSIMKYDNSEDWFLGETKLLVEKHLKNFKAHVFYGKMKFQALALENV